MISLKVLIVLSVILAYAASEPIVGLLIGKKIGFLGGLKVGLSKGYGYGGYGYGGYGGYGGYSGGYGHGYGHSYGHGYGSRYYGGHHHYW